MRVWQTTLLFVSAFSLIAASPSRQTPLEWYPQNCSKLQRITPLPLKINPVVAVACGYTGMTTISHSDKFFDVFISDQGAATIRSGKGVYPEGTAILKRKYSDAAGSVVELYTGMVKRSKGYNAETDDWEYFVATADGKVMENGALTSCIACHQAYKSFDYVTRAYLTSPSSYSADDSSSSDQNLTLKPVPPTDSAPRP